MRPLTARELEQERVERLAAKYALVWTGAERMWRASLPMLPHQEHALEAAGRALDLSGSTSPTRRGSKSSYAAACLSLVALGRMSDGVGWRPVQCVITDGAGIGCAIPCSMILLGSSTCMPAVSAPPIRAISISTMRAIAASSGWPIVISGV